MKIRRKFKGRKYSKGGSLPKYALGDSVPCGPEYVRDSNGNCVPIGAPIPRGDTPGWDSIKNPCV